MTVIRPKYEWLPSGPAEHRSGYDRDILFGRVFIEERSDGRWLWEGGLDKRIKFIVKPDKGFARDDVEAMICAEGHYEECLRSNGILR